MNNTVIEYAPEKINNFFCESITERYREEYISYLEEKYNARFLCETALHSSNAECLVFYVENPDTSQQGHNHYFGIMPNTYDPKKYMIFDATMIEDYHFCVLEAKNGELVFSRFRHHFCESEDGSVFVDGGREYGHKSADVPQERTFNMSIKDGKWIREPF